MALPSWVVGIDIGGTFTDVVAVEASTGERVTGKVLTTPADPLIGIFAALDAIGAKSGFTLSRTSQLVHGTTLAINTLIERKGARVGLVTTAGFRDLLAMGRSDRYDLYDLQIDVQSPVVPPERCVGVSERIDARGQIVQALDPGSLDAAVERLREQAIEAAAVCFLHAYANKKHEVAAANALRRALPAVYVSVSSDVAPMIREYERLLATAINAYVGPRVSIYLGRLTQALAAKSLAGVVRIMKSDGGSCTPPEASRYPVRILESGPAAGVIAGARTAVQCGQRLAVAFDMGGTTAKACLVVDGEAAITDELEVSRQERLKKGSGLPLRLPSIDLIEVGAGGGSIAAIGQLGLLQVGPASAGAVPGPACYRRGGQRPTVTDADLLLGYLNPDYFAGGTIPLDGKAAALAIKHHILRPSGTSDVTAAAWGIHDLVDENMARAVRLHCIEHGVDPAAITLIATGGAGPVHAGSVMAKLGARKVICPTDAGVASALGLILAPRTVEQTVTEIALLDEVGVAGIQERLDRIETALRHQASSVTSDMTIRHFLHLRLRGQAYDLRIPVSEPLTREGLAAAFVEEYTSRFGRPPGDGSLEIVNWTVRLVEERSLAMQSERPLGPYRPGFPRQAYFGLRDGWREARILDRASLLPGWRQTGPVLIEEEASTVVVGPGQFVFQDEHGNLHVEPVD